MISFFDYLDATDFLVFEPFEITESSLEAKVTGFFTVSLDADWILFKGKVVFWIAL